MEICMQYSVHKKTALLEEDGTTGPIRPSKNVWGQRVKLGTPNGSPTGERRQDIFRKCQITDAFGLHKNMNKSIRMTINTWYHRTSETETLPTWKIAYSVTLGRTTTMKLTLSSHAQQYVQQLCLKCPTLWQFIQHHQAQDPDTNLRLLLGEDLCDLTTLKRRGRELAILLESLHTRR
jgi:hypothetical protein